MTSEDYRATPADWSFIEDWRSDGGANAACLIELRARVEALEAAQQPTVKESLTAHPAPAGSLVDQVADAIYRNGTGDGFREEARAAIRAMAAAARAKDNQHWDPSSVVQIITWEMVAQWLEQEADRG